jgi:hypothetical protein
MNLKPLNDCARVRRLLEVVPPVFRGEVTKTLQLLRYSAWIAGFDAAREPDDALGNMKELLGFGDDDLYVGNPEAKR